MVNQELQKELARQKTLADQGLISQDPKVRLFLFTQTATLIFILLFSVSVVLLLTWSAHVTLPANILQSGANPVRDPRLPVPLFLLS